MELKIQYLKEFYCNITCQDIIELNYVIITTQAFVSSVTGYNKQLTSEHFIPL